MNEKRFNDHCVLLFAYCWWNKWQNTPLSVILLITVHHSAPLISSQVTHGSWLGFPASGDKRNTSYHQNVPLTKQNGSSLVRMPSLSLLLNLTTTDIDFQGSTNLNKESTAAAHRSSLYFKAASTLVTVHLKLQHVRFSAYPNTISTEFLCKHRSIKVMRYLFLQQNEFFVLSVHRHATKSESGKIITNSFNYYNQELWPSFPP